MQASAIGAEALRYYGNVCISGLTAAGKTTHAHLLAGEFGLTYVSGSQIQLNFRGLSPIQAKDFWITEAAKSLWNEHDFRRIDDELLRIESHTHGCVFDTSTMPWRRRKPALSIWLESDLASRSCKSIVSHRGRGVFAPHEYADRIEEKDRATIDLYNRLYRLEIGRDLSPFDLILDIGKLIATPSLEASLSSIRSVHAIVRAAAGWFLTGRSDFAEVYAKEIDARFDLVLRDRVHEAVARRAEGK
jgi:cytidylate kinase